MKRPQMPLALLLMLLALWIGQHRLEADGYVETDLVSDIPGRAAHLDPNLVNPWGIAFSATSPFWVSDNRTGLSTLYDGSGAPNSLVVTVPPPGGGTPPAAPTGVVFNGGIGFELSPGLPARFIFATEDGTLSGWNPGVAATTAILRVDNSASGAVYKGLAIGRSGAGDFIYAANFHAGTIDVFDSQFSPVSPPGGFTDPNLPSGFAPFNVQNFGGNLYVTYALHNSGGDDDLAGAGHGFVDVFDLNGNLLRRLMSQGVLNSPWGLAIAPAGFGGFANDLLVGNFGDGRINAFDVSTGDLVGTLADPAGNAVQIPGLWGLTFGNGGSGGNQEDLYFTAAIPGTGALEDHGLFGQLVYQVPEAGTSTLCLLGTLVFIAGSWRRVTSQAQAG
jgi:uncharacterized protein (TIGR03118 family)